MSWMWAAASCKGISHERSGTRKQDAYAAFAAGPAENRVLVCIVSDGAGSAPFGGEGASIVCRSLSLCAREFLRFAPSGLAADETVQEWVDAARDRVLYAAEKRSLEPRDFAATLIFVMSDGTQSLVAHIGDGCAVHRDEATGAWETMLWPDNGEYASTTSFVTDEPPLRLRIARHSGAVNGFAVFSDGIERLALDFAERRPFQPFFETMARPVGLSETLAGKDARLSEQLAAFLCSPSVNDRTDDDKTLIVVTRK